MTTDITELAQRLKLEVHRAVSNFNPQMNIKTRDLKELVEALEKAKQHIARQEQILLNQDESLSIRRGELEAAQQERENWHTSFDNERFRADKLAATLSNEIEQSANVRGQLLIAHKTLLNQQAKIAEMEEAEQKLCAANVTLDARAELAECRLAEMESRTVTVKLPDIMPPEAAPAHYWGSGESMAYADGYNKSAADLKTSFAQACSSAGVNVEFE